MAGKLTDLSPSVSKKLPAEFVVDTNLLVTYFLSAIVNRHKRDTKRTDQVFSEITSDRCLGFVAAHSVRELYHLYVRTVYSEELRRNRPRYEGALKERFPYRRGSYKWTDLFKIREGLMQDICRELDEIRLAMIASNLFLLQLDDVNTPSPDIMHEDQLLRYMKKYRLDSSDAAILIEARGAGVPAIVTLDSDFKRAARDFSVYTWL